MTDKTATITFRLPARVKKVTEKAAADDHRSVSSYIEKLLTEHLKEKGLLKK
jgi:hypothetical protein